jgi:N-acetylmuramoyl-L-alanine amidase
MSFKMKYEIKKDYIQKGRRRPGTYINPYFGVLHDTGNGGSTAQNNRDYYNNTPNDPSSASAQTFIDDKQILEVIPCTLDKTERAYHVRYNVPADNHLFGDDANDIGVGVELCWGKNQRTGYEINFDEAYKRFVWYCAYVSYKFNFPPTRWVGHEKLDPGRKTDPTNALKRYGKTYAQLLKDIVDEYNECTKPEPVKQASLPTKPVESTWQILKVIGSEYGIYSIPKTKWKEDSAKYVGWTFVARNRQMIDGKWWFELFLGDVSYGWIGREQIESVPYKWAEIKDDTVSYVHSDLKVECGKLSKGGRVAVLQEENDKYLIVSSNRPQWIPKTLVDM